jgi:phage terminase large subunit-like protein
VENEFAGVSLDQAREVADIYRIRIARAAAKRKDILTWGWALFPQKFFSPFCRELHEYFISIRGLPFTNTEAPRYHAKTTIKCFLIPIFQALEEPGLFRHYLNVQSTLEKAIAVNRAIKEEFETNRLLLSIYGDCQAEHWAEKQIVLKNRTIFTAIGAGQSIRGINYRNVRPDYIIIDDLYDEEDINNPDSTLKKNEWFWGSLYPARAQARVTAIHVQGTAINSEDLLEKMKAQDSIVSKTFRAIKDDDSILWPEVNTKESLAIDRERMGSVIFLREMQNERRDDATSIIKRPWIQEYDPHEVYKKFDKHFFVQAVFLCVDPSVGKNAESDPTGIALIVKCGYDDGSGNVFYIHDVWEEFLSLDARVRKLQEIADGADRRTIVTKVRIEAISGFGDFSSEVIRRTNLPVEEIDHVKDKMTNLEAKSHFFENGKVYVNKNIDQKKKDTLIHQLTTNHPKHDDVRDAILLGMDNESQLWDFV